MKKLKLLFPIFLCMILLASCRQKKEITSVDDLPGSKMGVQIGTTGATYAGDYEGDEAGSIVEKYNKGVDAIQALRQNKIDCVIIDEEPAKVFAEKNKDLIILSEEFVIEDYAICIAKENSELKEKLNAALAEIKADKTLELLEKNIQEQTRKREKLLIRFKILNDQTVPLSWLPMHNFHHMNIMKMEKLLVWMSTL